MKEQIASPRGLRAVPFISIVLAVVTSVSIGVWYHLMHQALAGTKRVAQLMLMPPVPIFRATPSLFLATLVATVVLTVCAAGLSALRRSRRAPGAALPGAVASNVLLFLLVLWLAGMFAITTLWAGAALVSTKSTSDAAVTLRSVDPAMQRLIFQASGGAINGTETGFIVSIGDPHGPTRDVDIGKSSCSLFCFVFARAMMSDSDECSCTTDTMDRIHALAGEMVKRSLVPAAICAFVALASALGLLTCGASQFGGAFEERRAAAGAAGSGVYKVHAENGVASNVVGGANDYYSARA